MKWSDVAGVVGKAAPLIGGVLGGPLGAQAGRMVASALGVPESPGAVAHALNTDPEAAIKLADLQSRERIAFAELAEKHFATLQVTTVTLLQADNADRDSARKREVEVRDATPRRLAFTVTAGYFVILAWTLKFGIPESGHDAILVLLGGLTGAWAGVMTYYFGSSSGSAAKTELLARGGK